MKQVHFNNHLAEIQHQVQRLKDLAPYISHERLNNMLVSISYQAEVLRLSFTDDETVQPSPESKDPRFSGNGA